MRYSGHIKVLNSDMKGKTLLCFESGQLFIILVSMNSNTNLALQYSEHTNPNIHFSSCPFFCLLCSNNIMCLSICGSRHFFFSFLTYTSVRLISGHTRSSALIEAPTSSLGPEAALS